MTLSLQMLSNNILLDGLQSMARQLAKPVEANVHVLADRITTIAAAPRMNAAAVSDEAGESRPDTAAVLENRRAVLKEAA